MAFEVPNYEQANSLVSEGTYEAIVKNSVSKHYKERQTVYIDTLGYPQRCRAKAPKPHNRANAMEA